MSTATDAPVWRDVVPVRPDFDRDSYGRPKVMLPDKSKRVSYTRTTTFVGAPEDLWNVNRWTQRQIALGLAARPDYILDINAHRGDKDKLNAICDRAKEVAGASIAATRGTAVHAFTELMDLGDELPRGLDSETRAMLDAYREAMKPFRIHGVEEHLVQDRLKVAGTTDRILSFRGQRFTGDIKTGSTIELGTGKIAGQLAMYAHSRPYDVTTDERGEGHGCSTSWSLVIHLPAERPGECTLHWVDLEAGWRWVEVARAVREQRAISYSAWRKDFDPDHRPDPTVSEIRAAAKEQNAQRERDAERRKLARMIDATDSEALLRKLWRDHASVWDDALTARAKQRISELEAES